MQRCKSERSSCAKVQKWEAEIHLQVSGLGNLEPGTGLQVRVQVRDLNLYLHPNT